MGFSFRFLRPALWDVSQAIFGADKAKQRLHAETAAIEDPSAPILDFGCATGNVTAAFIGHNYTGIDIDPVSIGYARFKFRRHPEMRFVASDIMTSEVRGPFDRIMFGCVAHHLDDASLSTILRRLRPLLKDGGFICFIDPVVTGSERPLLRLLMRLDRGKFHRPAAAYEELFARAGFDVLDKRVVEIRRPVFPVPRHVTYRIR